MAIIKSGMSNPEVSFNLDGLDYKKGVYIPYYRGQQIDANGNIDESKLEVGLRNENELEDVLQEPILITSWKKENGDSYQTLTDLLVDLTDLLGFNPAGKSAALKTAQYIIGWQDFADSNTSEANPLVQSNISGGEVQITNNNNDTATDGNTNVNAETTVKGLNDLWDTSTNTFIFDGTGIEKNDLFFIRFHINTSANIVPQDFDIRVDFYDQPAGQGNYIFSLRKSGQSINNSAGVFVEDFIYVEGYIGESILNGSAMAYLEGSSAFEVEIIGHKINIQKIAR